MHCSGTADATTDYKQHEEFSDGFLWLLMSLSHQHAITTLDAILAALLIATIAGMGYFAYEAHTTKTHPVASTAQPGTSISPPGRSPAATNQVRDFKIPELGVQFTVSADLAGLTYAIDAGSNGSSGSATDYGLTTPAVASFGQACGATGGGVGFLYLTNVATSSGNATIYQVPASNGEILAYSEPLASCGAIYPNYGTQQQGAVTAIKQALATVRPLQ